MFTAAEKAMAEGLEITFKNRMLWCEKCQDFTPHEVSFYGTESREGHFIVKVLERCQRTRFKIKCGRTTLQYLNVGDYNSLVANRYYE